MCINVARRLYGDRQIKSVAALLISRSCWFAVTPLPEALWEVSVKKAEVHLLPDQTSLPKEPILSAADLQGLGYEIRSDDPAPFCFYWINDQNRSNGNYLTADVAHDDAVEDAMDSNDLHRCADCGKLHTDQTLVAVKKLSMRVGPGDPMPSGECGDCGALVFPITSEE